MGAFGPVRFPIFAPSGWEDARTEPEPVEAPRLDHVHGFNAASRPAIILIDARYAAVAAGSLVALVDLEERGEQRFIACHSSSVTCLAYSPQQGIGASGEALRPGAPCAEVLLWCPGTRRRLSTLSFHQADVEAVGFAQGGEVLVTIGADRDHTLALWASAREGWFNHRKRGPTPTPLAVCSAYRGGFVHGILAAPDNRDSPDAPTRFVTFGQAHVKFWKSSRLAPHQKPLEGRRGAFGSEGTPRAVVAAAWVNAERLVAGGADGEIYFFEGTQALRKLSPHKASIAMLLPLRDAALLAVFSTGVCSLLHSDRAVDIDLSSLQGAPEAWARTSVVGGAAWQQSFVVLATRTHLLRLDIGNGPEQLRSCETLLWQASQPLTAVCAHPVEARVFTSSLDGGVRCYRSDTHMPMPEKSFKASSGVTCLAVSGCPPGASAWLAVGCDDGTLSVLCEEDSRYVFRRCITSKRAKLTCARFSACDASGAHPMWLAVGTDDGCIHTLCFKDPLCRNSAHSGPEAVTRAATLRGHAAPIHDVSFADTLPCVFLLSCDTAGQALAFNVSMARRLPSMAVVRDTPFSPWTSPIGWQVAGCWSKKKPVGEGPGTLPQRHFCEVAGRALIAVTGDVTDGTDVAPAVELFPFPCPTAPAQRPPQLLGPCAPMADLAYSGFSDTLLGVSDTALFVWSWKQGADAYGMGDAYAAADTLEDVAERRGDLARARQQADDRMSPDRYSGRSPLRQTQPGAAILETPEGRRKRIVAADGFGRPTENAICRNLFTPQQRTPGKSRRPGSHVQLAEEKRGAPGAAARAQSTPGRSPAIGPSPAREASPWYAGAPPRSLFDAGARAAAEVDNWADVAPLPGVSTPGASPAKGDDGFEVAGRQDSGGFAQQRRRGYGEDVPEHIQSFSPIGEMVQDAALGATRRVHEDTAARARSIHERQQFDSVGPLLGGGAPHARQLPYPQTSLQGGQGCEARQGSFVYRTRDAGACYEVEVQLPGGQLLRVVRNPLRRSLTFEGEILSQWELASPQEAHQKECPKERLVLQIPPGFDLQGPPARVERHFAQGRCLVAVARSGARGGARGGSGFGARGEAYAAWDDGAGGL